MDDFPVVSSKETISLSNVTFPAITLCQKETSEFAIIEGLGNYLDLAKDVPSEAIVIRNEVIKRYWKSRMKEDGCNKSWFAADINSLANYYKNCCNGKVWCQVIQIHSKNHIIV